LYKKKSLGQHFLSDVFTAQKIVSFANIKSDSVVLEIGPGDGSLTKWIYSIRPKKLILLELDKRFIDPLKANFLEAEIINKDACSFDISSFINSNKISDNLIVIGNLPYNVSTKIVENLISSKTIIKNMVLMFQKEVGDRICAASGNKDYGRLSLLVQEFFKIEKLLDLKPGVFTPPPKVDSVVLYFLPRTEALIELKDRKGYTKLIDYCFSNRRKMLRRILKGLYPENLVAHDDIFSYIENSTGLDLKKRPEALDIKDFEKLSNSLFDYFHKQEELSDKNKNLNN
jgi:16S rRNA (adenine1518-N6/adenine1519-N6)-dimethyltransferase